MFSRFTSTITAGVMLAGAFTLLTGMKSCASTDPSGESEDVVCSVAKDCDGLAHLDCVGEWSCDDGQCAWACGTIDPEIVLLPYPGACASSDQCGKGQLCSAAYGCFPSQCTADGSICTQDCLGLCVDQPGFDRCEQDADCGYGRWCDYTECVGNACEGVCRDKSPPVDPDLGCQSDSECGYGSRCEQICAADGYAFAPSEDPSESPKTMPVMPSCYGQCVPVDPYVGCASDSECGYGERCEQICSVGMDFAPAENPSDVPGASPVAPCYGQCVPVNPNPGCTSDAECGKGNRCEMMCAGGAAMDPAETPSGEPDAMPMPILPCLGQCVPVDPPSPECGADGTCPEGFECQCQSDPNCPYCDVCLMKCVPVEPPPVGCTDDSQCAYGLMCQIDACPPCWDGAYCGPCSGTCVPKPVEPPNACQADADCADGQLCAVACPAIACTPDWCPPCTGTCVDVKPPPPTTCVVSGCSGEICAAEPMASVCIYSPWYECLQLATCGNYAPEGGCGWEPTPELQACLAKFGAP
jgi:eight-cysteine-cluster-containing protein